MSRRFVVMSRREQLDAGVLDAADRDAVVDRRDNSVAVYGTTSSSLTTPLSEVAEALNGVSEAADLTELHATCDASDRETRLLLRAAYWRSWYEWDTTMEESATQTVRAEAAALGIDAGSALRALEAVTGTDGDRSEADRIRLALVSLGVPAE